jgi:hypothetical protein
MSHGRPSSYRQDATRRTDFGVSIRAFVAALLFSGFASCQTMPPGNEKYREEPKKTVYKSAEENPDVAPVIEPRQKVPGQ